MNQTLNEHHIAQYNILLIEDHTVTKPSMLNNLEIYKLYLFLMYLVQPNLIYSSHSIQLQNAATTIEHRIAELNQAVN